MTVFPNLQPPGANAGQRAFAAKFMPTAERYAMTEDEALQRAIAYRREYMIQLALYGARVRRARRARTEAAT
jgi:hypothetical protein